MEVHAAQQIIAHPNPHHGLREFVYASNYHDLARREVAIMRSHAAVELKTSACIGSGPLPLTSVHYALHGIEVTHNVDSDPVAASTGSALLAALGTRGAYIVDDASTVTLAPSVDAVLLAALVGSNTAEKLRIIKNLAQYIVDGGILAVRSASGPRALLYPPFEWAAIAMELKALKLELVGHYEPHDAVINSLVVFRKSGA
jgi:nicotianamine synthase